MAVKTPFDDLDPSAVLKPKDIAARLDVDARSVRRAIARGELAASRACGIRVLAGDAAAWWRARLVVAVKPAPEPPSEPAPARQRPALSPSRKQLRRSSERLPLPARPGRS